MTSTLPRIRAVLLSSLALVAAASTLASTRFHFALARTAPADEATVDRVEAVKLWFTEPPAEGTVSIHLLDAQGALVPSTDPAVDSEDPRAFAVAPAETLSAGRYTVDWRGMGTDGHVVRGAFSFLVTGR